MYRHFSAKKTLCLQPLIPIAIGTSLLIFTGCSPKIKMGLWYKSHKEAATALGGWVANNPAEGALLLAMDCTDRKKFKQKITDALNNTQTEQSAQQGYTMWQGQKIYSGNAPRRGGEQEDGFGDWCRKYPKAAKKLRSHAKALCKTGLGILNGSIPIK